MAGWNHNDLTYISGDRTNPAAAVRSAASPTDWNIHDPAGYIFNGQHVVYTRTDNHIHEL